MTDTDRNRESSRADRVPPHNIDAEEAALGASLLSTAAADQVCEAAQPADFYKPAHRMIAEAIRSLRSTGRAVDIVTVAEELRQDGTLGDVGGSEYLHGLFTATPAVSTAGHYAKIVHDTSALRRLIYAAGDIAEIAYRSSNEPGVAVSQAQDVLVKLAGVTGGVAGSTLDVADIAALLETDLEPELAAFLTRSDGTALLYAGKMHTFQAEPSSGKSWLALAAVVEVLAFGGSAIYLDFEDTPTGILRRLMQLGASRDDVRERVRYVRPLGRFGAAERLELDRILDDVNPDIVVIDGVGEALARNGLSEDKADDVLTWFEMLPRPIANRGAAVLMIDHVAKDPEHRGRWARGSGAKLGAVDGAVYQVKVIVPFSRHRAGVVKLIVAKDRPGGVGAISETAAVVNIEPHGAGERVIVTFDPDKAETSPQDTFKPTILMGKVAEELATATVPLTATALANIVRSAKPKMVREAIARLIAEGYVEQAPGKTKTLTLVKPYDGAPAGYTTRHAPADDVDPPPQLFVPEEPAWLADEARDAAEAIARDPNQ